MDNISYIEYDQLDKKNSILLESFLKENNFELNTFLVSPVWINTTLNLYDISCRLIIFFQYDEMIAFHMRFDEFRGYIRVSNYGFIIRNLLTPILKMIFAYSMWRYPLIVKKNVSNEVFEYLNDCLESIIKKIKHVKFSPITDNRVKKFNNEEVSMWATYILDLRSKAYSDVFASYSRSLRRSLNKSRSNPNIKCQKLDFSDKREVINFVKWVEIAQKTTGKKIKHDVETLIRDRNEFIENGYIYEIFLVKLNNQMILGSTVIYGDDQFVNEAELNASEYAKKMKIIIHDLIRDEVVQYCIIKGISFFDLSGFNPNENRSKKEEGIRFSKARFKANKFQYPILNW